MSRYVVALVGLVTIAGGLLLSRPLAPPALAGVGGTGNFLRKQINIYNRGDLDGEVATFAEAAVLVGPGSCTPASPCVGKDAIRAALAASIADHAQAIIVTLEEAGSTATGLLELRSDRIRAAGSERALFAYVVQVQSGLVAVSVRVPELSDPQTAAFVASLQ